MNTNCTQFSTDMDDSVLSGMILAEDNEMAPMGSGGYRIRQIGQPDGAIHIQFNQMDCAPSPNHHAFIKDGKIWATHMKGWISELLSAKGITFSCETVKNPPFIEQVMQELCAA